MEGPATSQGAPPGRLPGGSRAAQKRQLALSLTPRVRKDRGSVRGPSAVRPTPIEVSVVIPVFNEEESLPILHGEIVEHVGGLGVPWEVIYVDDRSTDTSLEVLLGFRRACPQVRVVAFRHNAGQTPKRWFGCNGTHDFFLRFRPTMMLIASTMTEKPIAA